MRCTIPRQPVPARIFAANRRAWATRYRAGWTIFTLTDGIVAQGVTDVREAKRLADEASIR